MCNWGQTELVRVKIPADLSHDGQSYWKDVGIDACIAPIVRALQVAGIDMRGSCCGHGKEDGRIDLQDGRTLVIKGNSMNESEPKEFEPPLDPGIKRAVEILYNAGIETYESCEGGEGHSYKEPAIRFHGERAEGFRALAIALQNGLPVSALRRVWRILDGEPDGPTWEIVFWRKM